MALILDLQQGALAQLRHNGFINNLYQGMLSSMQWLHIHLDVPEFCLPRVHSPHVIITRKWTLPCFHTDMHLLSVYMSM
jgi:hypothetical protein